MEAGSPGALRARGRMLASGRDLHWSRLREPMRLRTMFVVVPAAASLGGGRLAVDDRMGRPWEGVVGLCACERGGCGGGRRRRSWRRGWEKTRGRKEEGVGHIRRHRISYKLKRGGS